MDTYFSNPEYWYQMMIISDKSYYHIEMGTKKISSINNIMLIAEANEEIIGTVRNLLNTSQIYDLPKPKPFIPIKRKYDFNFLDCDIIASYNINNKKCIIAYKDDNIIISFDGTSSINEILYDLDFIMETYYDNVNIMKNNCSFNSGLIKILFNIKLKDSDIQIHDDNYHTYKKNYDNCFNFIKDIIQRIMFLNKNKNANIHITGHSLGAMLSSAFSVFISDIFLESSIFVTLFGTTKCCDINTIKYIKTKSNLHFNNCIQYGDIVPSIYLPLIKKKYHIGNTIDDYEKAYILDYIIPFSDNYMTKINKISLNSYYFYFSWIINFFRLQYHILVIYKMNIENLLKNQI